MQRLDRLDIFPSQLGVVFSICEVKQAHEICVIDFQSLNLVKSSPISKSLLLFLIQICREIRLLYSLDCVKFLPIARVITELVSDILDF